MAGERPDWSRVEALFPSLLELAPAARADFLERECRDAPALRRELESLLEAALAGDDRLGRPPALIVRGPPE